MAKKFNKTIKPDVTRKLGKNYLQAQNPGNNQSKNKGNTQRLDLLDRTDNFFQKHQDKVFYLSLVLTFVISIILFNFCVSISGDDASYIVRAADFIKDFKYPGFQARFIQ